MLPVRGVGRVGANDAQLVFFRLFLFFVCFFFSPAHSLSRCLLVVVVCHACTTAMSY